MSKVFVIDTNKQPLNPVHPGRARILLSTGKAAVFKRYPFTIVLKAEVAHPVLEPLRLKIDPGSKTTGLALINDANGEVVFAAELAHRGEQIKRRLDDRHTVRKSRRSRHTRYRKPRCDNRRNKKKGWLPPSLESRICNVITWVGCLQRSCPISAISQELVKFDLQQMGNPEVAGIEYQQGTLFGYEVREYVLEKWGENVPIAGKNRSHCRLSTLFLAPFGSMIASAISRLLAQCATTRRESRTFASSCHSSLMC
jgi:RRXRR protein